MENQKMKIRRKFTAFSFSWKIFMKIFMENGYVHIKILYLSLQRFLQCYADFLTKYTIYEGHIMLQLQFIGAQITDYIGFTPSRLSGMTYNTLAAKTTDA
jgi:hypothetical protein